MRSRLHAAMRVNAAHSGTVIAIAPLQSLTAAFGDWAWPGATPGDQLQDLRHSLAAYAGTRLEAWSGWPH
jgi:hypothetical protein